jgi:hypothetical protein
MTQIYPPVVPSRLVPEELYNVLWRVYQYRGHWIVQREAGSCAVLVFPHPSEEALRFLVPDDLLGGIQSAQDPETAETRPLGSVLPAPLAVGQLFHAAVLVDALLDGAAHLQTPWASRPGYPLTAKWFAVSFHAPGSHFSPLQPTGQSTGRFDIRRTSTPDADGTEVLGCLVIDLLQQAPLQLAEGTLLIRHEWRRGGQAHQDAALACVESLLECMRPPRRR